MVDQALDAADNELLQATSATDVRVLHTAARSAQTAGSFSLTSSRVAYVSDRWDAKHPHQLTALRSVRIRATAKRARLGASTVIGGKDGALQVRPATFPGLRRFGETVVAAARNITAYAVGSSRLGATRAGSGSRSVPRL